MESNFEDKESIIINHFRLENGDMIFIGSDGKDDIEIYDKEKKIYYINNDESKILKVIEKSNGNITEIVRLINNSGNIIDDISDNHLPKIASNIN